MLIGLSAALKVLHDFQKHTLKILCVFFKPPLHPVFAATNQLISVLVSIPAFIGRGERRVETQTDLGRSGNA